MQRPKRLLWALSGSAIVLGVAVGATGASAEADAGASTGPLSFGGPSTPSQGLESGVGERRLDQALSTALQHQQRGADSQQRVDQLDETARQLLQQFRADSQRLEQEQQVTHQLRARIARQAAEAEAIEQQLRELSHTGREIEPLLERMMEALTQFVQLDLPFLQQERQLRQDTLRKLLDDPQATLAEKYRRLLSAYQVEADYGRTLETYPQRLSIGGVTVLVNVIRFGRVGLYYLSPDEQQLGHWDRNAGQFVALEDSFRDPLRQALSVARHQAPPQLLPLPLIVPRRELAAAPRQASEPKR